MREVCAGIFTASILRSPALNRNAWQGEVLLPISTRGTNQIRHGRLARGHRGGFHLCERRARRAGGGGLLEVGNPKSEVRDIQPRTESSCRLRPPVFLGQICANDGGSFRRKRFSSRPDARTDADAVRFIRRQTSERHRRRDDYGQPQSAGLQRLQIKIVLRRLKRFRNVQGRRKFSRPQSGQESRWQMADGRWNSNFSHLPFISTFVRRIMLR